MNKEQEERLLEKIKQNHQKNKKSYNDMPLDDLLDTVPNLKALFNHIEHITLPLKKLQKTYSFLETIQSLDYVSQSIRTIFSSKIFKTIELIQKQHTNVFMDLYKIDVHITNLRENSTIITKKEVNLISKTLDKKNELIVTQQNKIQDLQREVERLNLEKQEKLSIKEMFKIIMQQSSYNQNEVKELRQELSTLTTKFTENQILNNINIKSDKCTLSNEQINILKLRKKLSPDNKYELMIEHLPGINISNLKRIAKDINSKLGGNNIDESLRLFENQYYNLD